MFVKKEKYNNLKNTLKAINDIKISLYQKNIELQKELLKLQKENNELKEKLKENKNGRRNSKSNNGRKTTLH